MKTEITLFGKTIDLKKLIIVLSKIGLILLIAISIFLLNRSVLLSPDDYNYTWVQGRSDGSKVSNLLDCIETGRYFYTHWTGRVIPHVLVGIFRNMNAHVFEIVNTIAFMIFVLTIPKVLGKKSTFLSILAVFGYLAYSTMFGEKFAWVSGALNYLWPAMFLSIFIYLFYNYFFDKKRINKLGLIALTLYAFIAGFMHENTAFVGGAFLCAVIGFNIKKYWNFDKTKKIFVTLIFIMFCLGAFANIFAPGNFHRMDSEGKGISLAFLNNYKMNKKVLEVVLLSMLGAFLVENKELAKQEELNIFLKRNWKKYKWNTIKEEFLYFILPALVASLPMALISYFPPRAFLAYELMFMIVLANNVIILADFFKDKNIFIAGVSILLTLVVFSKYSPSTLAQINYIIPYKDKITNQLIEASEKNEKDVVISKFDYLQWIHREDFINIDNFFPELNHKMPVNVLIANFYNLGRVTAVGENEYLIELKVDTEGINPYELINKETEENVGFMEYDDEIRYCIPKEQLGRFLLDCRKNNLKEKIIYYRVRTVGEEITDTVKLEDIIIY